MYICTYVRGVGVAGERYIEDATLALSPRTELHIHTNTPTTRATAGIMPASPRVAQVILVGQPNIAIL